MALARPSRSTFSSLRSKCEGGKKTAAWGPRHAAFNCQTSSMRTALTEASPFRRGDPTTEFFLVTRVNFRERGPETAGERPRLSARPVGSASRLALSGVRGRAVLPVVACGAHQGLDIEHEPFDRGHADGITGGDGRRPIGASPPGSATDRN